MKTKLLTILLLLAMTASVAMILVACDTEHTHTYSTEWMTDDTHHWKAATCEHTAEASEKAEHTWGTDNKCTVCQKNKIVIEHTHTYEIEWTTDDTHHWKAATCEHTTEASEKAEHTWGTDNKCTVCQKEKVVINTVTQTEWMNAFNLLNVDGEWTGKYTSSQHNVEGVIQTVSTNNCTSHTTVERNGIIYESYVVFDDDTHIATAYSGQRTATTNVESWNKQTLPTNLYDEYRARFSLFGSFDLVKGYRIENDEGQDYQLSDLYQAFTYNEEDGVYSATLWANTSTEDWVDYSSMYIEMTFEAGKIIQIMYYYHLDNENIIMNIDIGYTAEVIIPQEALNAGSQN